MDEFELGKQGWFEVQNVEKNDFLNTKLTTDQYGIWYSVKFTGDASTHLWQTKTPPVEGEKYWGSIELTKSGKTTKFHWDKQNTPTTDRPEKAHDTSFKADPVKQDNIHRSVALDNAVKACKAMTTDTNKAPMNKETVLEVAEAFYTWLKNETPTKASDKASEDKPEPKPDKIIADDGEQINLADIPF